MTKRIDYGKVQEADLYWENQYNQITRIEPTEPTYMRRPVSQMEPIRKQPPYSEESNLDFLKRNQSLDRWECHLTLRFGYKRYSRFFGALAKQLYREYRAWHEEKVVRVVTRSLFRKPRSRPLPGEQLKMEFA